MGFHDVLQNCNSFIVFAHTAPDADAIASAMVTKMWLESINPKNTVDVILDINQEGLELYENLLIKSYNNPRLTSYECAICVDCASEGRIALGGYELQNFKHIINIDHHSSNTYFGTANIVLPKFSSTGEVIYLLMKRFNFSLTDIMAKFIYTSIITDTNCFSKISINSHTHQTVADLLKFNFDYKAIKVYFFQNNSKSKIYLTQKAFGSLRFYNNDTIATMKITQRNFAQTFATFEDSMGIVDSGLAIEDVKICACFIEKQPNTYYVSLRGKGAVDIVALATYFGGGGSAGLGAFQFEGSLDKVETEFIEKATQIISNLPEDENKEIDF